MFYKKSQHRHKNGYRNGYHMNGTAANGAPLEHEYSEPEAPLRPNPEKFLPIPRLKFGTAAAIVFLISVVCFAVSYDGDLVFDDSEAIIGNKDLLPETPISNIFFNDFWGKKLDSKTSHKSYRPLTVLTFRLSYYVGGGLEPIFFHIPNIILHGIVSVLILRTFSILFGSYTVDVDSGETQFMAARSSVLCALLFAVHPIHTESFQYMLLGTLLLLSVYTVRCIQRSSQWRNEMELFSSGPQVCPGNAKVHYNIGKLHADNGNTEYAITKYRQAIALNPEYDQAMNNLGNILKDKDELFEAEQLLERAVSIRKEFAAAWMNLGIVKASLKKHEEAEKCYVTAITHRRKYPDCYYNLGNLYLEVKQYDRAVEAWTNATNLKPTHSQAWINMAVVYDNIERFEESITVTMKALRHLPEEPQLYFNLGNVYGKKAEFEESEKYFQKAIKLSPNNAKFVANMAVLYHRWEKYDKAEAAYLKALSINPAEPNVQQNLAMLRRKMNKKTS
ncbi:protein O-mannosyl-transferase TMTC4-like [Mercenaria mercenaria]|uniref:protein O-mannosyl-transferase TMTC4-like n=1 Tax=Mercenaria mercenaria TaxID=6596 RepID=UPI00234EA5F3|nr:protein O-mannosyl-transferase TMTC4-like [Mercenaria mercenaria]